MEQGIGNMDKPVHVHKENSSNRARRSQRAKQTQKQNKKNIAMNEWLATREAKEARHQDERQRDRSSIT